MSKKKLLFGFFAVMLYLYAYQLAEGRLSAWGLAIYNLAVIMMMLLGIMAGSKITEVKNEH